MIQREIMAGVGQSMSGNHLGIGGGENNFAKKAKVVLLESTVATNTADIGVNATNIATNTSAIATNTSAIATNTSAIATNTADIATNSGDIATNSGDIATNTADIGVNATNIATNTSAIATNTADIATNSGDIAANTSAIATNTANITSNSNAITANTNAITSNTGAIAAIANATTIAATTGVVAGSGTLDASAVMEADSTTKGFLPPRMTTAQRTAIGSPANGLVVYDTEEGSLFVHNGVAWSAVGATVTYPYMSLSMVTTPVDGGHLSVSAVDDMLIPWNHANYLNTDYFEQQTLLVTNDIVRIKVAGLYYVSYQYFVYDTPGDFITTGISVNHTLLNGGYHRPTTQHGATRKTDTSSGNSIASGSAIIDLNVDDTIGIYIYTVSNSSVSHGYHSYLYPSFVAVYLGQKQV
jgi:hypothetical protein